jgi:hypothetical protein
LLLSVIMLANSSLDMVLRNASESQACGGRFSQLYPIAWG